LTASFDNRDNRRIRALFLNTRSALGADVMVHLSLIQNLDPEHVEVFVATNANSADLAATLEHLKCLPKDRVLVRNLGHEWQAAGRGLPVRLVNGVKNLSVLPTIVRLAKFIRKHRIDIIHSTDRPRDALFATLLAKWTGCKNLIHVHNGWNEYFSRATRWGLANCSAVLAISMFTRKSFADAGIPDSKLYLVYNSVDSKRFDAANAQPGTFRERLGVAPHAPLIGIVARIMLWKGHLELIEALAKVRETIPSVQLAMIGKEDLLAIDGSPAFGARLRERIQQLGFERNVHWVGWYDDVPTAIHDLDVLAMPSWEEPFGLAVVEAMAMERPVVGFASGALPEIIADGVEGLLVPPKDVDALAVALTQLLTDPGLRDRMGRAGRQRVVKDFDPRCKAAELADVYTSVLDTR
jgi:glycosyltransferase involved in cell wall biosynthesis